MPIVIVDELDKPKESKDSSVRWRAVRSSSLIMTSKAEAGPGRKAYAPRRRSRMGVFAGGFRTSGLLEAALRKRQRWRLRRRTVTPDKCQVQPDK